MKCSGKNRQDKPCEKNAMRGRDFCRTHGGTKPIGPANPAYRHGGRSKFLAFSKRLRAQYEEALADPELISLRSDVALLRARIYELLESAESELLWAKTQSAFRELEAAIKSKKAKTISASLTQLRDLIARGHADSARWREIYKVMELSGRAKEREIRRLVLMEQFISAEELLAIMGRIANIAARTITDRNSLRAFADEINRLVNDTGVTRDWAQPSTDHSDSPDIPARAALPPSCGVSEPAQGSTPPKRIVGIYDEKQIAPAQTERTEQT